MKSKFPRIHISEFEWEFGDCTTLSVMPNELAALETWISSLVIPRNSLYNACIKQQSRAFTSRSWTALVYRHWTQQLNWSFKININFVCIGIGGQHETTSNKHPKKHSTSHVPVNSYQQLWRIPLNYPWINGISQNSQLRSQNVKTEENTERYVSEISWQAAAYIEPELIRYTMKASAIKHHSSVLVQHDGSNWITNGADRKYSINM